MLSKQSLEILKQLFGANSNLQLPVSITEQVVEIRAWTDEQLLIDSTTNTEDKKD